MTRRKTNGVRVGRSSVSGKGLFATQTFKRGQVIAVYRGRVLHNDKAKPNRYLVKLTNEYVLDGSGRHNLGRYINHACKRTNAELVIAPIKRQAWVEATRTIRPGEEIFYDYGEEYREAYLSDCKCPHCRDRRTAGRHVRIHQPQMALDKSGRDKR
jgi:SET domain-containing protein